MEHGGDIYGNSIQYDFSVNLNPLGMPEAVKKALVGSIGSWGAYPDPQCRKLRRLLSEKLFSDCAAPASETFGCDPASLVFGNGAAELIYGIVQALRPGQALIPTPAFSEYAKALATVGCKISYFPLEPEKGFRMDCRAFADRITDETDLVFLCSPNNPNGLLIPDDGIRLIADVCREHGSVLLIDECFRTLAVPGETSPICSRRKNPFPSGNDKAAHTAGSTAFRSEPHVITLRAFTKTFAMAGLRLGYAIVNDPALIAALAANRQPWSISVPAQIAGAAALKECGSYLEHARALIRGQRTVMSEALTAMGLTVFPSDANYLLFYTSDHLLKEKLMKSGILIRDCSDYRGLTPGYFRVSIKSPEENKILLDNIK